MNRLERRIRRRLLRDPENGWLGGVCEGIARAFGLPATGVRVAMVILALLFTNLTLIGYAAAWLFMDSREEALGLDR
ncbi:MAG: PspC domain-containing protein [Pseudomonadales bacterium]|jgi:phage shock protein C|nr:PspC domain-containing protein [Pseudomonadales bacterium]